MGWLGTVEEMASFAWSLRNVEMITLDFKELEL